MADRYRDAIYIGVTADIAVRVHQRRTGAGSDFCCRYGLHRLVHAEWTEYIADAIAREKLMKTWLRAWKVRLVEETNPEWRDRYAVILGAAGEAGPPPARG